MRRFLLQVVIPFCICLIPLLAAALVAACIPPDALNFYLEHIGPMDGLILALGSLSDASGGFRAQVIFQQYSPAITATGSGLFMALVSILPTWIVLMGRDMIRALGGSRPTPPGDAP